MTAYAISSIGLFLDIVGVILIWRYGFAADVSRPSGAQILVTESSEVDPRALPYSKLALYCLVAGFGLQLAANVMQMASLSAS